MKQIKNKNILDFLNNFSSNFVGILVSIILIILTISSLFIRATFRNVSYLDYNEGLYFTINFIPLILLGCAFLFIGIYLFYKLLKNINSKILLIISIIIICIISITYVLWVKAPVRADQKFVLAAAIQFKDNNYSFLEKANYLFMHPLQLGIVLFIELLVKIFNTTSPIIIQILNIPFVLVNSYLIYKITCLLFDNENVNKILCVILAMFILFPMMCVLVYGNIFGFTFSLLAILFLLKYYNSRKYIYLFLIPISLTISIILKSNYEIILVAICISLILDFLATLNKKNIFIILIALILFGISNPILYKIVSIRSGTEINSGTPMSSYFAMGISKPTTRNAGWYHETINVENLYSENNYNSQETNDASIKIVKERLKEFIQSPKTMIKFYADKILSTWCEPSFQTLWEAEPLEEFDNTSEEYQNYLVNNKILISLYHGKLNKILRYMLNIYEILILAFSSISVIILLKNKELNYKNFILILCFLGGFLFHILWETKCIYVIPFLFLLLPNAAHGFYITFDKINNTNIIKKFVFRKD